MNLHNAAVVCYKHCMKLVMRFDSTVVQIYFCLCQLPSALQYRQHLNSDNCLEDKRQDNSNLCCVPQLFMEAFEQFLNMHFGLVLLLGIVFHC